MTKEELMRERAEFNGVLLDQFHRAKNLLSKCTDASLYTGEANSLLGYANALLYEIGLNIALTGEKREIQTIVKNLPKHPPTDESPFPEPDAPTETAVEEPAPVQTYTIEEVRNILIGLNKKYGEQAQIVPSTLKKLGYAKLSEVPAEKYAELVASAKEIAGET